MTEQKPAKMADEPTSACSAHNAPWMDFRDVEALARMLRWEDYTVLHSCEARLEMARV